MKPPQRDFWMNRAGSPLIFLVPGGTGTKRPGMKGYDAIAASFWLRGYNVQVFVASGQDGAPGKYSMQGSLDEARACLHSIQELVVPSMVVLVGSCAGGVLAGHLVSESTIPALLALWETPLRFTSDNHEEFIRRASDVGISVTEDYFSKTLDFSDVAKSIASPVLVGYGNATNPPVFPASEYELIGHALTNARVEPCFLEGADHNLLRGSSPELLTSFIARLREFVTRHQHAAVG